MELIKHLVDFILHIDVHLAEMTANYGLWVYLILFLIVFMETGFVVTPFLPGDSLLFAAGALAALGSLNIWFILAILAAAAILGDTANYWIGHFFGKQLIANPRIPIKQEHIDETNKFFDKHGGKTIFLARFVPIVRTFAPFVAGIGKMHYSTFITYNVVGGLVWVAAFTGAGYFFGNVPAVKHNFTLVILVIIAVSVLPMVYHFVATKLKPRKT